VSKEVSYTIDYSVRNDKVTAQTSQEIQGKWLKRWVFKLFLETDI